LLTIGIIGKTNVGKTTLFNAATLLNAEIATYPFTTTKPNVGIAYVCDVCVCQELEVTDTPLNSTCLDGWRYAPVRIIDVPGLVKDAWRGRGLGNQFLSVISQADALIHVVDASGSIDADGKIATPGSGNPVLDALDIEDEIHHWIADILLRNKPAISHDAATATPATGIATILSGLKAGLHHVQTALTTTQLEDVPFPQWSLEQTIQFTAALLPLIKPTLILANKMDLPTAAENLDALTEYYGRSLVAACSAEAELALRRAEQRGLLSYVPGHEQFRIRDDAQLTLEQRRGIKYIEQRVLAKWMRTGIQQALNTVAFKLLKTNMIYPVSDEVTYTDHHGNVLPDVHLLPDGATPFDLAQRVHSRLAENYVLAIDAKTGIRLPKDYRLRHRDVITIMVTSRARPRR
jgi:ribosome-binding ATPase YchF (GTP1/OBG family)